MAYPYNPKIAPAIGNGLGGFPQKAAAVAAPPVNFFGIMDGAPILNSATLAVNTTNIGFTIVDARRTFIELTYCGTNGSGVATGSGTGVCLGSDGAIRGLSSTSSTSTVYSSMKFSVANGATSITINSQIGIANYFFTIVEYAVQVLFEETQTAIDTPSSRTFSNTIKNPKKTIIASAEGNQKTVKMVNNFGKPIMSTGIHNDGYSSLVTVTNSNTVTLLGSSVGQQHSIKLIEYSW